MTETKPPHPNKQRATRDWEGLLATAARRLIRLDHGSAALALAESSIERMRANSEWTRIDIEIEVSGDHYDALTAPEIYANGEDVNDFGNMFELPGTSVLATVFTAALPTGIECVSVEVKIRNEAAEADWREHVRASLESGPSNQGRPFGTSRVLTHSGLNYRSKPEVAIAEKLELVEDMIFLPNSAAVTGKVQKEPDFLIFYKGRVGVLEVDGPTHAGRMADDSLRDSFFQRQRIFVKHYPAEKCAADPGWVIKDFLSLLLKSPA